VEGRGVKDLVIKNIVDVNMGFIISIIVINLNNSKGLNRTLNSILQNIDEFTELVVIDGGSTDGSQLVAGGFKNIINIFVSETDGGIYDAMNKGVRESSGSWVIFINSGDELLCKISDVRRQLFDDLRILYGRTLVKSGKTTLFVWGKQFSNPIDVITNPPFFHQSIFYNRKYIKQFPLEYTIIADRVMTYDIIKDQNKEAWKFLNMQISSFDDGGISSVSLGVIIKEEKIFLKQAGLLTIRNKLYIHKKRMILGMKSIIISTPLYTPLRKVWWALRSLR